MHKLVTVVTLLLLTACNIFQDNLPGGLSLEEHALSKAPTSDPFSFTPLTETQDDILAQHQAMRSQVSLNTYTFVDGNPAIVQPWNGGELTAQVFTDAGETVEQFVQVSSFDDVLLKVSAGIPTPAMPLQGVWTYGTHWALEILYASPEVWIGQVFIDGEMVNQKNQYDEAFGFQLLAGKPFYFYKRGGLIGINYDGLEFNPGYQEIPHYQCCSASILNPTPAEDMVAFFARRDTTWYYIELGMFK